MCALYVRCTLSVLQKECRSLGCALYVRCALSVGKYGNIFLFRKVILASNIFRYLVKMACVTHTITYVWQLSNKFRGMWVFTLVNNKWKDLSVPLILQAYRTVILFLEFSPPLQGSPFKLTALLGGSMQNSPVSSALYICS